MSLRSCLRAQTIFLQHPTAQPAAAASAVIFDIKLRAADRAGSDAPYTDTRAWGTHSTAAELTSPCTTTSRDTATPEYHPPPRTPLPSPLPAPTPPPTLAYNQHPPPLPRCPRDRTRLEEGTGTADAAEAITSSPRGRMRRSPGPRRAGNGCRGVARTCSFPEPRSIM